MLELKPIISPRLIDKSWFQILISLKSMLSRGASLQFRWQDPNPISQLVYLTIRGSKFWEKSHCDLKYVGETRNLPKQIQTWAGFKPNPLKY